MSVQNERIILVDVNLKQSSYIYMMLDVFLALLRQSKG